MARFNNPRRASHWLPYFVEHSRQWRVDAPRWSRIVRESLASANSGADIDLNQYRVGCNAWMDACLSELRTAYGDLIVGSRQLEPFLARLDWVLDQVPEVAECVLHPLHGSLGTGSMLGAGEELGGLLLVAWQSASLHAGKTDDERATVQARTRYLRILSLFTRLAQRELSRAPKLLHAAATHLLRLSPPEAHRDLLELHRIASREVANRAPEPHGVKLDRLSVWVDCAHETALSLENRIDPPDHLTGLLTRQRKAFRSMLSGPFTLLMCPAFDEFVEIDLWACGAYAVLNSVSRLRDTVAGPPAVLVSLAPLA